MRLGLAARVAGIVALLAAGAQAMPAKAASVPIEGRGTLTEVVGPLSADASGQFTLARGSSVGSAKLTMHWVSGSTYTATVRGWVGGQTLDLSYTADVQEPRTDYVTCVAACSPSLSDPGAFIFTATGSGTAAGGGPATSTRCDTTEWCTTVTTRYALALTLDP